MSTSRTHHGIVVGVDGSPPSKVAVNWAAREALLRTLPLTIIHVIPSPMVSMAPGVLMLPELTVQLETHGQEVLREARRIAEQATAGSNAINVDTEVITAGVAHSHRFVQRGQHDRGRLPGTGRDRAAPAGIGELGPLAPRALPGRGDP